MNSHLNSQGILRKHLGGGEAFMPIDKILEKIPYSELGKRPTGLPYSFYEIFYHIKFTQNDILEYCNQENYIAPSWPGDYWPRHPEPEDKRSWNDLKSTYFQDREELETLLNSEKTSLLDSVPSGKNHTFLREILLVIEHTAYHTGQLLIILRLLGKHSS